MRLKDGREVATDQVIEGGRYNAYDCPGPDGKDAYIDHRSTTNPMGRYVEAEFHHALLSLDMDEGVTPMFVTCPDHDRTATSRWYRVDRRLIEHLMPVRMVWRKATNGELKRERREGGEHYRLGGLAREWVPVSPVTASRTAS